MLVANLRRDYVRTLFLNLKEFNFDHIDNLLSSIEEEGKKEITSASPTVSSVSVCRALDMRYIGQEHAVTVDIDMSTYKLKDINRIKAAFDKVHLQRYGYFSEKESAEIVSVRTSVIGQMPKPLLNKISPHNPKVKPTLRSAYLDGTSQAVPVYWRPELGAGFEIKGPAFIEEYASTTTLFLNDILRVDDYGNLAIEVANE
jgi:N-methylhydantoinase A